MVFGYRAPSGTIVGNDSDNTHASPDSIALDFSHLVKLESKNFTGTSNFIVFTDYIEMIARAMSGKLLKCKEQYRDANVLPGIVSTMVMYSISTSDPSDKLYASHMSRTQIEMLVEYEEDNLESGLRVVSCEIISSTIEKSMHCRTVVPVINCSIGDVVFIPSLGVTISPVIRFFEVVDE